MTPWFLEQFQMRVYLSMMGKDRVEALANRHGITRGKVIDLLVRAIAPEDLDRAIEKVQENDAKLIAAWRESGRCIPS